MSRNHAKDQARNSSLVPVKLDLTSRNGGLQEAVLTFGGSPDNPVSAALQIPQSIWEKCDQWYDHLETMWTAGKGVRHFGGERTVN